MATIVHRPPHIRRRREVIAAGAIGLGAGTLALARAGHRRDVTDGSPGVPLILHVSVVHEATHAPLRNAKVTIRHADALGRRLLQGSQRTDLRGRASFRTIYPGWLEAPAPARAQATHIDVEVRDRGRVVHTRKLFFDQLFSDAVHACEPYASHGDAHVTNGEDPAFVAAGVHSLLSLHRRGDGYEARVEVAVGAASPGGVRTSSASG